MSRGGRGGGRGGGAAGRGGGGVFATGSSLMGGFTYGEIVDAAKEADGKKLFPVGGEATAIFTLAICRTMGTVR